MFRSQLSGKQYGPHDKPVRVVVETRPRTYRNDEGKISFGSEIVRELLVGEDEIEEARHAH